MSTEVHEASHVACAILLGREVEYTWRVVGGPLPDGTQGHARIPIETLEPTQVPIVLVGYWVTDTPGWPPSFEQALSEPREGLGKILHRLHATEEQYEATIEWTRREILENEEFIALRDALARALGRVPHLDREAIEDLARIYQPEPQENFTRAA